MSKPTLRRRTLAGAATTVATFALGFALAVAVSGSATAASSPSSTTKSTSTKKTTTTSTTTAGQTTPGVQTTPTDPQTPASQFFVINGTVNAASDHERIGSSAFPNYANGAVDNYYSLAHSHVDNSPFAQGTASPADTGPVGQTAAAGNFQQPQYADARWPGGPDKATYGSQGGPFATATAGEYMATADASLATNGLSGPGPTGKLTLAVPKGFTDALRQALALWKSTWQPRLAPAAPTPARPTAPVPNAGPTLPKPGITVPKADTGTVTTPISPLAAPGDTATGNPSPAPPAPQVSTPGAPSVDPPRGLSAAPPADGETLLSSSTLATLVPIAEAGKADTAKDTTTTTTTDTTKTDTTATAPAPTYTLVTSGESRLGRVSVGGGQIVIEGIHVTASIKNDGTPTYKAAVSVASASIGGVPVTIDEDGVHVAGQGSALPYKQASDALNNALKQAGVQLFLVGPEVTTCGQSGSGSGGGGGTTTTTTTGTTTTTPTTTSDQSQQSSSCDQGGPSSTTCQPSPTGTTTTTTTPIPAGPSSSTTTTTQTTTSSCDQGSTGCDQAGPSTFGSTTTGTTTTTRTTTTSTQPQGTTSTTPSWCGAPGTMPTTGSCTPGASPGTTAGPGAPPGATAPPSGSLDPMNPTGGASSTEETVTATGVHLVFTQPVNQSGVPAQYVEHILGEVFVDSLAVPAPPLPPLDLSSGASLSGGSGTASCAAGGHSGKKVSGSSAAGGSGSSAGGSATSATGGTSPASLASSGATAGAGATMQPGGSGTTATSLPAAFATALRKPLWLLVAYLVWQALVIGTGVSLRSWRRGDVA